MSLWSASHVGVGNATSLTSLASSSAIAALHMAGMCRTVGTGAANTSSNVGASCGLGEVRAVPGLGGVCSGGGSIGIGTCGGSGAVFGPPGAARQFLHRAAMGTNVRHGSLHSLTPRLCSTPCGTCSPWTVCFAAMCETRARRVRVTNASGHDRMGHVVGHGAGTCGVSAVLGRGAGACGGGASSSPSLTSSPSLLGAPHPIRTGNLGRCASRVAGVPSGALRDWLASPRVTRSWPWTA